MLIGASLIIGLVALRYNNPKALPGPEEPVYSGLNLSQWLEVFYDGYPEEAGINRTSTPGDREAAAEAIRKIGTNAIPVLLSWLSNERSPYHDEECALALKVCDILKAEARPAASSLIQLIDQSHDQAARWYGFLCLQKVESDKAILVPFLVTLVHDQNKNLSYYACEMLVRLDPVASERAGALALYPSLHPYAPGDFEEAKMPTPAPAPNAVQSESAMGLADVTRVTQAYRKEATRLLIAEANRVALELRLTESLPIMESNLVAVHVTPPVLARAMQAIGNITTSNYVYYVSIENKFSFLERPLGSDPKQEFDTLKKQYYWPMSRFNTNAAFQLATQFLSAASMDVAALNLDCIVDIRAWTPEGPRGEHFVPLYWVLWRKGSRPSATVELFEPTKALRQLRINESKYILRQPLVISNQIDHSSVSSK